MKKKIITSLLILFTIFMAGAGVTMLNLYNTTANLRSIIDLHRVEIIRQDLVINAQTVQSHLYAFGTTFGQELDIIVDNVIDLDASANNCLSCHHTKQMTRELEEMVAIVDQYQGALSQLITTSANRQRVERLRTVAIGIGATLLSKVHNMAFIAGERLNEKSMRSLDEISNSRLILLLTLVASFFIASVIAITMTKQVTEPIYELLDATRHIKAGELGYTTHYMATGEFRELIDSFNDMSLTLDESNSKVMRHLASLSNLYSITLNFHSIADISEIYRELSYGASDLVGADQCGMMLLEGEDLVHKYPAVGIDREASKLLRFAAADIVDFCPSENRRACIINSEVSMSPTAEADKKLNVRNLMLVWLRRRGKIIGAIRVANKRAGDFNQEDVQHLAILANNVTVAIENARLYDDLRSRMLELKETQQQLVQAAKLAAVGELASNVAHELNNPLTSVLGYAQLIKEEKNPENITADLEVIEKECRRAKDIVRQLLEFTRMRPLYITEVDINASLAYVVDLVRINLRVKNIEIETDYAPDTVIRADDNQIKQVFVNIVNNAVQSMQESGRLTIITKADEDKVITTVTDTGTGIPEENIEKIFEPFFTTKTEQGTGVGLSVSFKIIKRHDGDIRVQSVEGKGTTFTITLPRDSAATKTEEPPPEAPA